ncbi:MAG TPA: response regulator [Bryobacteraceae bacterium]|nr:response regulator [Bryobacteraceae bacterium]
METQLFSPDDTAEATNESRTRHILFVDEDPRFLDDLKEMSRQMPAAWQPAFRATARDALRELDQHDFDVIVTGARLPDMPGFELLAEVRQRYPQAVRIVFWHGKKEDLAIRAANTAHQYLVKPCDVMTLRRTLDMALRLRDMLAAPKLQTLISRIASLPSLPALYNQLIESLNDPDVSSRELGEIISQDVGLTSKILQIANSAFFGLYRYVASPAEAAVYLGVDTIRSLTLSAGVFSAFRQNGPPRDFLEQLQRHSTTTGMVASLIAKAERCSKRDCDTSMLGGLLHDAGKLVLAVHYPSEYADLLAGANNNGRTHSEAEQQTFGATHAEMGAYLLWLWGFPDPVCNAVAYHHRPAEFSPNRFSAAGAIHIADALDHEAGDPLGTGPRSRFDESYLAALGLSDRIPEWRSLYEQYCSKGQKTG